VDKLQIKRMVAYNDYWYAVRFTGDTVPFKAMVSTLKQYGQRNAYWCKGVFDGTGAWLVRDDILERVADRFDNYEVKLGIAKRTYERKVKEGLA
jgi:hypothetical protein